MKVAVLCLVAFFALASAVRIRPSNAAAIKTQFDEFVKNFGRQYEDQAEYNRRLGYFTTNLQRLAVLRADMAKNGRTSWEAGVTMFFDMSDDEKSFYTGRQKVSAAGLATSCLAHGVTAPRVSDEAILAAPTSWDWRTKGVVNPVKNQGQCGSCWAFSTIGVIESKWAITGHTLTQFSEQEIVDCSVGCSEEPPYGKVCNQGCNGGWQWNAFYDIIGWKGVDLENQYTYTAQTGTCKKASYTSYAPITNYTCLSTPQGSTADETAMAAYLVANGPIAIAMDAGLLETYTGGIIVPTAGECSQVQLDHAIIIVGYDVDATAGPFWIVRNSWGSAWGEAGYFRIIRGQNACGLAAAVSDVIM